MTYEPKGVCCKEMHVTIEDSVITSLDFTGGCDGNLKGIAALAVGKRPEDIVDMLRGITCGQRPTSCPDQLALALMHVL